MHTALRFLVAPCEAYDASRTCTMAGRADHRTFWDRSGTNSGQTVKAGCLLEQTEGSYPIDARIVLKRIVAPMQGTMKMPYTFGDATAYETS